MVAYAQALQYWAEKADLPAGGRPCLLAESVKELWEEMRCYLSFLDEEVLKGVVPLEEMSAIPTEEANPQSTATPAGTTKEQVTMGQSGNQLQRGRPLSSLVGRRYYTPPNPWWLLDRSPICQETQN